MLNHLPESWSRALHAELGRIRPAPLAGFLKRCLGVRRVAAMVKEGTFWVDPVSTLGRALLRYGEYEGRTSATLRGLLREGDVFIDVGANEGFFTVVGARAAGESGRVIAIEPQRRLHAVIERNLASNELRNVVVRDYAVGDTNGGGRIHLAPMTNSGSSGFYRKTAYRLATQDVQLLTLDEMFRREGIAGCDVMKMDIEGAEYEAIMGSPETFRCGRVKALVLETHPDVLVSQGKSVSTITQLLTQSGYVLDQNFPQSSVWRWGPSGSREPD